MNHPLPGASPRPSSFPPDIASTLQTLVLDSTAVRDFLDRLAHFIAEHLSTAESPVLCGITLIRPRTAATVASSSDRAQVMDEVQYSFGDGPCLDSARRNVTNHVPDVLDEGERWADYLAEIAGHGLRSILAVPIRLTTADEGSVADDGTSGEKAAINLYADAPHTFSEDDIADAQNLAAAIATTVAIAVRLAATSDRAGHLEAALDSRTTIDIATGIIMAQNRCSQDDAVTILKAASSARNIKLRELAASVIASVSSEEPVTHFDN